MSNELLTVFNDFLKNIVTCLQDISELQQNQFEALRDLEAVIATGTGAAQAAAFRPSAARAIVKMGQGTDPNPTLELVK